MLLGMGKLVRKKNYVLIKFCQATLGSCLIIIGIYLKVRSKFFKPRKAVLFTGQCYYNPWYLSRGLRKLGWTADVLNWDADPKTQIYYHGEDFKLDYRSNYAVVTHAFFYLRAILKYDIFHFSNSHSIQFSNFVTALFKALWGQGSEIYFLKKIGKKIVYTNNGCSDGVSQTAFSKWGPVSVCNICVWKNNATVCSDVRNLTWGKFRNEVADYQCLYGGNRVDFNDAPTVHEVPEFYCLNTDFWHPDIVVPQQFKLEKKHQDTVFVYHAVGHKTERTNSSGVNIKSSHIYLPLIDKLQQEGVNIELISPEGVSNKEVRYYQVQADIFLEMLTYGWYGANVREAMMLAKPVICFIRPEWLSSLRKELPECANELPIISATPETVEEILRELISDSAKRKEIGQKSREFAMKWHSDNAGSKRFDQIYTKLLKID